MKASAAESIEVAPAVGERQVRDAHGRVRTVPDGWALLEPGDAGLTRRVKAAGPTWTVKEKKGRRAFSRGVWAPAANIEAAAAALAQERATPAYARRREADAKRRARDQARYADTFEAAVLDFLAFAPQHAALARVLADAIADRATPVGSGTVARTQRIPLPERAEAATLAWLRHHTTEYDSMNIARVKGMRRQTRRHLAERSRRLLAAYRRGDDIDPDTCPLYQALVF